MKPGTRIKTTLTSRVWMGPTV